LSFSKKSVDDRCNLNQAGDVTILIQIKIGEFMLE
jgi:hypothetical protein